MSLPDAYALVRRHLSQETDEKADDNLAIFALVDEMTFDGFSLWKAKAATNLAFIFERRSRACADWSLHVALG